MKKVFYLGLLISSFAFWSCSKSDSSVPVVVDFSVVVSGQAPTAQITITNNTTGAYSYEWTFGEGANISTSTDLTPSVLTIDKAGNFTITLKASNGSDEDEVTKTIIVDGNSALVTYSDVEFGLNAGDASYGRLFSFETGKIYKDNEVDAAVGPKINLAFASMGNTMYYFQSPTVVDYNVPGASVTKVTNWFSTCPISISDFDGMTDDSKLSGLTINEADDSFGNSSIPGIVLFELSTGRKGAIETKAVNSSRLLVDIKIQKY
jgi:FOG: PKD repeat